MKSYEDLQNFDTWTDEEKDQYTVNVIKMLVLDGVRNANSGHSGGPLSSADFAFMLFKNYLNYDPINPDWFKRDRFILSAGHESMLLYALLSFIGWLDKNDLMNFRQLHSKTPGHPEVEIPGVEATTGPLGQGFAMGVGMALSESILRAGFGRYTEKADDLVGHFTYVLAGDGDLQEPVALGAASMAGHWGLSRLVVYYDSNNAQISGKVDRSDSTNYASVFEGFGWHVQEIDGHDHGQIGEAIEKAQVVDRPSLIIGKTIMASGTATRETDHETHGSPLPQEEIDETKELMGLPQESFYIPGKVVEYFMSRSGELTSQIESWKKLVQEELKNDTIKDYWMCTVEEQLPELVIPDFEQGTSIATRKAFGLTLDSLAGQLDNLVGGSADLEPSNYTWNFAESFKDFSMGNRTWRNLAFGVREFPMAAAMNGMALHGGVIPFGGTFLVFADYERPALRLAGLQKCRVIHEFTHDSFYVGEDGPTHQPVEHAMALRTIPNFNIYRPADARETAVCFQIAIESRETPSALLLTRQGVPVLDLKFSEIEKGVKNGAYAVRDMADPELVLLATGSEVSLAMDVANQMTDKRIRVVSMPCWEIFNTQPVEYRHALIPPSGAMKISLEAGITMGWEKYVGPNGLSIGLNHYGASAPAKDLAEEFGFTVDQVEQKIRDHLKTLL